MHRLRRLLLVVLASLPLAALAQPRAGEDYKILQVQQPVEGNAKVEVLAFFWYGCPHCYNLEPRLEAWERKLPSYVRLVRVPAVLSQNWARDAAIFYALDALGALERLHRPLFDAIHRDKLRTDNAAAFNAWLAKQGVDAKRFDETLKSFSVQSKARRAAQLTLAYRVDGTPAMAVHGRYTIPNDDRILETVDHLVALVRRDLGQAKK